MPESRGLILQAFLVLPVQRIPRYKLLLEDLLKKTPSNHCDYVDLKSAIALIGEIAVFFNEAIRSHEMMMDMLSIQKSLLGVKDVIENLVEHCYSWKTIA